MNLSFDILLIIGIIAFYLYDSIVTLDSDDMVLIEGEGRWQFFVPRSDWQFRGKHVYLPNPLLPARSLFRAKWGALQDGQALQDIEILQRLLSKQSLLRFTTVMLFVVLQLAIPIVLYRFGTARELLGLLVLAYFLIIMMGLAVYRSRSALLLSGKDVWKLALDGLLCAPFAVNMVRKLSLRHVIHEDGVSFAKRVFDAETFAELVQSLSRHIDNELEMLDEAGERHQQLSTYKAQIAGMLP